MNFEGTEKRVSGAILSGWMVQTKSFVTGCGVTFSVRHGGTNDVLKHFLTGKHPILDL